jgi:preprotein translocase subunit SecE
MKCEGDRLSHSTLTLHTRTRGVSSVVKLSVSKTELLGSNPSAPARLSKASGQIPDSKGSRSMAKTALVAGEPANGPQRSEPSRGPPPPTRTRATSSTDVRAEMRKVVTPSRKEVQATTTVVLVTVFLFGFYFWVD